MPPEILLPPETLRIQAKEIVELKKRPIPFSDFLTPYSLLLKDQGWSELLLKVPQVKEGQISREDVVACFKDAEKEPRGSEVAFIACMLWGFGHTFADGPVKTWLGLADPKFQSQFSKAIRSLSCAPPQLGEALTHIRGIREIGVLYGTKVLYFMGKALGTATMPLIYDAKIRASLAAILGERAVKETFDQPKGHIGYVDYCKTLNTWASHLVPRCRPDQIELFLFKAKDELAKAYKTKGSPLG